MTYKVIGAANSCMYAIGMIRESIALKVKVTSIIMYFIFVVFI